MVVHGGPTLAEDQATMNGSMMIVEAPSLAAAKVFSMLQLRAICENLCDRGDVGGQAASKTDQHLL